MTVALSQVYWYFPVDTASGTDLSATVLALSLDKTNWFNATYVASPPAGVVTAAGAPQSGYTRFWWQAFAGPSQQLPLVYGKQYVHGKLTDTPEVPYFAWVVDVPND